MKSDNYHSSAFASSTFIIVLHPPRTQHVQYLGEHCFQSLQFMIDSDTQCLEGLRRRMYCSWFIRNSSGCQCCQLRRARNCASCSLSYYTPCNLARAGFLTVTPENVCQFLFARTIHQITG